MSDKDLKKFQKAQEVMTEKLLKAIKKERKKTVSAIIKEQEKVFDRISALEEKLVQKIEAMVDKESIANTKSTSGKSKEPETFKAKPVISEVSFSSPEFPAVQQNPDLPVKEKSKDFDARDARGILKKFKTVEEIDKFLIGEVRKTVIKEANIVKESLEEVSD